MILNGDLGEANGKRREGQVLGDAEFTDEEGAKGNRLKHWASNPG
jgi:hypothetical protein